ncbi:plasmid fertility inhibition factor family protein [Pantoea sp. SGAir0183]
MSTDLIYNKHPILASCGICQIGREYGGFGDRVCTFSVGLKEGKVAWMKLSLRQYSEKWVVIVRKRPFLNAWARSGDEPQLAAGDEKVWRKDYKFFRAEKGFSQGYHNPVPLALCDAHYEIEKGLPVLHAGFTNGVTRTIWLMANGAEIFPVSVPSERDARLLFRGVGDRTTEPLSVSFLYSLC